MLLVLARDTNFLGCKFKDLSLVFPSSQFEHWHGLQNITLINNFVIKYFFEETARILLPLFFHWYKQIMYILQDLRPIKKKERKYFVVYFYEIIFQYEFVYIIFTFLNLKHKRICSQSLKRLTQTNLKTTFFSDTERVALFIQYPFMIYQCVGNN